MTSRPAAQLALGSAEPLTVPVTGSSVAGSSVAGSSVAALQAGAPDAPVVLLVPGFTGSKEDFAPILDPLADAGLRAVAIDLPGQFESPGPADPDDYTPRRLARAVLEVAASLSSAPVRLLGHSFGGLVSRAAVLAAPSRFESLVQLSSGPAGLPPSRRSAVEQMAPILAGSGVAGVLAAISAAEAQNPDRSEQSPELAAFLDRRFLAGSPSMLLGMSAALRAEPDRVAELAATGVPVLVVHGVDDDAWPTESQAEMASRLGARYVVLPDAAHSAAVENPAALVSALLDFWH